MNRRNFIGTLLGAAAAAVAPSVTVADAPIDLTGFTPFFWDTLPIKYEKVHSAYVRIHPYEQAGNVWQLSARYCRAPFTKVLYFKSDSEDVLQVIHLSEDAQILQKQAWEARDLFPKTETTLDKITGTRNSGP